MDAALTKPRFQAQGAVRQGAMYVSRAADKELPIALLDGDFCCVLGPRQIGKSSLRVHAENVLREQGVLCVTVDLNSIGTEKVAAEDWYFGLVRRVARSLKLPDPADFWQQRRDLTPVDRWSLYLRDEMLSHVPHPVVIFIDEIDVVLRLPFSRDDFFASLRALYDSRAEDDAYERLTFCLIGVSTPAALIEDPVRTPFNIGQPILLTDFTRQELEGFAPGFAHLGEDPRAILDAVFTWTAGHPYMTQRLCKALAEEPLVGDTGPAQVDHAVAELYLQRGRVEDFNLANAERCITEDLFGVPSAQMLRLYRRLLEGETVPVEGNNPVQMVLRLTGMAAERRDEQGRACLCIRNRIFATVFDREWLNRKEAGRFFADALDRWLDSGRDDAYVLRGQMLEQALAWAKERADTGPAEVEFLSAGVGVKNREEEVRLRAEIDRRGREQAEKLAQEKEELARKKDRYNGFLLIAVALLGIGLFGTGALYRRLGQEIEKRSDEKTEKYLKRARDAEAARVEASAAAAAATEWAAQSSRKHEEQMAAIRESHRQEVDSITKLSNMYKKRAEDEEKALRKDPTATKRMVDQHSKHIIDSVQPSIESAKHELLSGPK